MSIKTFGFCINSDTWRPEKKQYWLMTPGFGLAHTRVPSSRVLRSIEQIEEEAQA